MALYRCSSQRKAFGVNLEGTLDMFSLRELIEMSVYSSVTGVLHLQGSQGAGSIFFRDGAAYHCASHAGVGEAALIALFELHEAHFTFTADSTFDAATIHGDTLGIVRYCEEMAMRWRVVRATLPNIHVIPQLVSNPGVDTLSIDRSDFAMIAGVDGVRTLGEIADMFTLDLLDVCETAVRLWQDHLLVFATVSAQPTHIAPSSVAPSVDDSAPPDRPSSSVIDRILASLPSIKKPTVAGNDKPSSTPYIAPHIDEDPILRLLRG